MNILLLLLFVLRRLPSGMYVGRIQNDVEGQDHI